jgi:sarcosine oxidase
VIGLGGVGSAALYQLAGRGKRVLGLDQLEPPHALGSSHGDSRITRQAIGENVAYSPLALRSHEIWRELERETGDELLMVTGGLMMAPDESREIFHGTSAFLDQTIAAARKYGIDHELLSSRDIARRFPQFQLHGSEMGYYEPGAGALRPELCVAAHLKQATARGASVHTSERVVALEPAAGATAVYVRTEQSTYEAGTVVLAAGPWMTSFTPPAWRRQIRVTRQVMYWFRPERELDFRPGAFPVFVWIFGNRFLYGLPLLDGAGAGVKVATEQDDVETTADTVDRTVSNAEVETFARDYLEDCLPGLMAECVRAETCLYTQTPGSDFLIDWHPDMPRLLIASPCSGHGFKHTAALGEVLADMIEGRPPLVDSDLFSSRHLTDLAS